MPKLSESMLERLAQFEKKMDEKKHDIELLSGSEPDNLWKRIGNFFLAKRHTKMARDIAETFHDQLVLVMSQLNLETHVVVKNLHGGGLLRDLDAVKTARHDSLGRAGCADGTREEIITKIEDWIVSTDCNQRIFWLHGKGGSGKTAVAWTIANDCHKRQDVLDANFFCSASPGNGDKEYNSSSILRTLAYQLRKDPCFRRELIAHLVANEKGLKDDFRGPGAQKLILDPLESMRKLLLAMPTIIFILDGIDECSSPSDISALLRALICIHDAIPSVKILISSRHTSRLGAILQPSSRYLAFNLDTVDRDKVERDMEAWLNEATRDFAGDSQESLVRRILEEANGSFVYGSTRCEELRASPELILCFLDETCADLPVKPGDIGSLYGHIVRRAITSVKSLTKRIELYLFLRWIAGSLPMGLTVSEPISIEEVSCFLDIELGEREEFLRRLSTVLIASDDLFPSLRILHVTFRDFLMNTQLLNLVQAKLSTPPSSLRYHLAMQSMGCMKRNLRRNICGIGLELNSEVENLDALVIKNITPALAYACESWIHHFVEVSAQTLENDDMDLPYIVEKLNAFLKSDNVLHWIEVHILRKTFDQMIKEDLPSLEKWFRKNFENVPNSSKTLQILSDF
ncbi:hypothetical protein D9758_010782 [Tetrapyrgos nigripes]|uniref:Nephrocystin 3-like N-terminal domain-containing protein n=1 Tax=Tetrapyrgos nigripes TaxID=182062 RepID=A0A8H5D8Y1_9AGAR|nr:hypothetical protein D9758_010782 [Tetrapyrgos nigripes]